MPLIHLATCHLYSKLDVVSLIKVCVVSYQHEWSCDIKPVMTNDMFYGLAVNTFISLLWFVLCLSPFFYASIWSTAMATSIMFSGCLYVCIYVHLYVCVHLHEYLCDISGTP